MKNHHHHTPNKPKGLMIINGESSSSIDVLLGIKEVRRLELEAHVQRSALSSPNSTFLSILDAINQGAQTTNELVYCAYFFGTIKPYQYPGHAGIESMEEQMEEDFIKS